MDFKEQVTHVFLAEKKPSWLSCFLAGSFLCTAFGNAFEPISIFAWLQPVFLLLTVSAYHPELNTVNSPVVERPWKVTATVYGLILLTQTIGFAIGFGGFFNNPKFDLGGFLIVLAGGFLLWAVLLLFCVGTHVRFCLKYPMASLSMLVFPACWATAWLLLSLGPLGVAFNPATSLLDGTALVQAVSLFGSSFIVFLHGWAATVLSTFFHAHFFPSDRSSHHKSPRNHLYALSIVIVSLLVYGGLRFTWGDFYQRDFSAALTPSNQVSCILGPEQKLDSTENHDWMLNHTQDRVRAGDDLVVWSEASLEVHGNEGEKALLEKLRGIQTNSASRALIAAAYVKIGPELNNNLMVLMGPDGKVLWRYLKSHLVPFVEADFQPGSGEIAVFDTKNFGRLGGAICMDMEIPSYLRQAGQQKVDLFIQPSWTWGPIGVWAFTAESLRAVENGFGWFRCGSGGVSAAISPYYRTHFFRRTGFKEVFTTEVPRFSHVPTVYTYGGFLFGWACVLFAMLVFLLLALPTRVIETLRQTGLGNQLLGSLEDEETGHQRVGSTQQLL